MAGAGAGIGAAGGVVSAVCCCAVSWASVSPSIVQDDDDRRLAISISCAWSGPIGEPRTYGGGGFVIPASASTQWATLARRRPVRRSPSSARQCPVMTDARSMSTLRKRPSDGYLRTMRWPPSVAKHPSRIAAVYVMETIAVEYSSLVANSATCRTKIMSDVNSPIMTHAGVGRSYATLRVRMILVRRGDSRLNVRYTEWSWGRSSSRGRKSYTLRGSGKGESRARLYLRVSENVA